MALITDLFGKPSADAEHSVATTVTADRTAGVTVLSCFDLSTFTEDTPVYFVTYTKTTDPVTGEVTITDTTSWKGLVNAGANTITNLTIAPGYVDGGNLIGQFVECIPTSYWGNELIDGILAEHNPDGTHKDVNADSVTTPDLTATAATATDLTVTNAPTFTIGGAIYKESQYYLNSGSPHTWTKPTGLKFVVVEVQGGGGGGGGTPATSASTWSAGGGGGGGAYARKKILAGDLGATETVTVGAGGASNSGTSGGSGGNSSFGAHCTANGGAGGATGTAPSTQGCVVNGGAGSSSGSGDLVMPGGDGNWGFTQTGNNNVGGGGHGGNSYLGASRNGNAANTSGQTGRNYGGGGSGSARAGSQPATGGGAGAPGIVIVHEYF